MQVRLQKFMAEAGIASRRKCEELIKSGRVSVDGNVADVMGLKIDPSINKVCLDGKRIDTSNASEKLYIALNKPVGYITSVSDQFGRPTVMDLLGADLPAGSRLYPVGRLDYDTSGLLILTNDGQLAYRLTHPKHNIEKTYVAETDRPLSQSDIAALQRGVELSDGPTHPAKVRLGDDKGESAGKNIAIITITEGRNRQVRRMFEAVGKNVVRLHRVSVCGVFLGDLESGGRRYLSADEIAALWGDEVDGNNRKGY